MGNARLGTFTLPGFPLLIAALAIGCRPAAQDNGGGAPNHGGPSIQASSSTTPPPPEGAVDAPSTPAVPRRSFDPARHGYVGSVACAECHAEITRDYEQSHSMARSLKPLGQELPIEDFTVAKFRPPGLREYEVERGDEGTFHHERWLDVDAQPIYDQREKIEFVLGSGRRGRSYVLARDGFLFQSSIAWYSQEQKWDLSPGYSPQSHGRFDRKLITQCIYCHAGLTSVEDLSSERYSAQPFVEPSIGCERCHGPGEAHVAHQTKNPTAGRDDTIVNPQHLEPAEREAVCYQCHLRRDPTFLQPGRSPFDYRPGQPYDDTWLTYVPRDPRPDELSTIVEQHRASHCFRKSDGRFGCTSCHDPHRRVGADQRDAFYRDRCLKCHADQGCSLPEPRRREAHDSCIQCHMPTSPARGVPHTALTDHRMLRDPSSAPAPNAERPIESERLVPFTYGVARGSSERQRRAEGLLRLHLGFTRRAPDQLQQGERLLNPAQLAPADLVPQFADDLIVLDHLGQLYAVLNRPHDARLAWETALKAEPTHEEIRRRLVVLLQQTGAHPQAARLAQSLCADHPYSAEYHWLLADSLRQQGQWPEAVREAEKTIERDPTALAVRAWLARAYAELGRDRDNQREQQTLKRLQGLRATPLGDE